MLREQRRDLEEMREAEGEAQASGGAEATDETMRDVLSDPDEALLEALQPSADESHVKVVPLPNPPTA